MDYQMESMRMPVRRILECTKFPQRTSECQAVVTELTDGIMRLRRTIATAMLDKLASNSPKVSAAVEHVRGIVALSRETAEDIARSAAAAPIRSVGIVGAGIMGAAIAREHAARGIPVVLVDTNAESLGCAAKLMTNNSTLVRCTSSLSDLECCDLVLESIAEKRAAKQSLYQQLTPHLAKNSVIATNTSTIPIARLASGLAAPDRFGGMHFCHPVRLRPLVEIIPGAATDTGTIASIVTHTLSLGLLPLVVADGPGFVVNRLLMDYLNAALDLISTGLSPRDIDAAMLEFGMPMGPLRQLDEIGLDTALQSGIVLSEVSEHRSKGTELLVALVKSKQLGKKAGAGIYCYPSRTTNHALEAFTASSQNRLDPTAIGLRLLTAMVREAHRLIDEGKASAWQIDLATIFGLGFPCWRGGLLWWSEDGMED
jgi:3-hydroxyacyl-CoA dehydrogenase